jgi:putative transposase
MRSKLKRYYGMGHLHFLTFSCYHRKPLLGTVRARNRFVKIIEEVRAGFEFQLIGYVVMPDHVHLLVSEPRKGTPSTVLQVLKQRVLRGLRGKRRTVSDAQLRFRFPEPEPEPQRFWQRRFYDFNVWSRVKRREKLSYMHENPVTRKLVQYPRDWP